MTPSSVSPYCAMERIEDVDRGHVDDDGARADPPYGFQKGVPQLEKIPVGQRGLDGRDEIGALLENRNFHYFLGSAVRAEVTRSRPRASG